jgi:hypothetical protein
MSGMLAKVMNSTVGTSNFKSLDEAVYNRFKNDVRLVGAEEVLFSYDGGWTELSDIPTTSYRGYITTKSIKFSHSGTVIFKTTQPHPESSTVTYVITIRDSSGNNLKQISNEVEGSGEAYDLDITMAFNVTAGTPYKIILSRTSTKPKNQDLKICAVPVLIGSDVTLV